MQCWQGLDDVPDSFGRSAVAIGVFDGVHRGHQRIIATASQAAARLGLPVVALTFDPHPDEVVRPGSHPPLLCTLRRRVDLLAGLGVDAVCVLPFTREFSLLEPEEFGRVVLAGRLHAQWVTVGENFRFGHRAAGDAATLRRLGAEYGFTAEQVPLLGADGVMVSSSEIRDALGAGDAAAAARDLGRPHRVEGVVVRGHQRGRALGFPTANLDLPPHTAIPADGVYAGWLAILDKEGRDTQRWPAAISVGTNPTFGDEARVVEAYALDRDDLELYGEQAAVDFAARLRGMDTFTSVEDLMAQMRRDVAEARTLVGGLGHERGVG